jgi:hypothetical protein
VAPGWSQYARACSVPVFKYREEVRTFAIQTRFSANADPVLTRANYLAGKPSMIKGNFALISNGTAGWTRTTDLLIHSQQF